ncbi:MAG: sigma-70 family RNA polymerase sigma factor [Isosphaeraceae bacterium]|nr:sigma-70 family RNA polymerase sigma factor [Isosphaeraceae bacterium]
MTHQLQEVLRSGALGSLSDGELLSRFLEGGEAAARSFDLLVARHGPMVRSVCRQVLAADHDADDAFQATFLVLVRRAASIRNRDSVASWLHGVARRISLRAKRYARTRRLVPLSDAPSESEDLHGRDEVVHAIQEEIARLPEHYRVPILLCEIGGQTHANAAAQLKCPIGTVSGRLSRAKSLLRERIARRGIVASATLVASALASSRSKAGDVGSLLGTAQSASKLAASSRPVLWARSFLAARFALELRVVTACLILLGGGLASLYAGSDSMSAQPALELASESSTHRAVLQERDRESGPTATSDPIISATIAPDGRSFVMIRGNGSVTVWDVDRNCERVTYRGHRAPILSLAFSSDGHSIITSDADRNLKIWATTSGLEQLSTTLATSRDLQTALIEAGAVAAPEKS